MIPYLTLPETIGPGIHPFGLLIAIGVVVGYSWGSRRARAYELPGSLIRDIALRVVIPAIFLSHVFEVLMYRPALVLDDPLVLLRFGDGISALGGMISAVVLFVVYVRTAGLLDRWRKVGDVAMEGFIVGWIFGRLGCSLMHDHPGTRSDFFLAVAYPDGPRHDLGLYEFLYTLLFLWPVSIVLYRRRVPPGTQIAAFALLYAPFRLAFDYLRVADVRYMGWTPAQYASVAVLVAGAFVYRSIRGHRRLA